MSVDLAWDEDGLLPVIVQDWQNGQVLMLAYMNAEALARTLETGQAHYWSRSRQQLWHKGETSGHFQTVKEVRYDCDGDALLLRVEQTGAACHTGQRSCFYRALGPGDAPSEGEEPQAAVPVAAADVLARLFAVVQDRQANPRPGSYTCQLFAQGKDEIAKKVGEEAIEVVLAASNQGPDRLVYESADLLYHLLVLLAAHGLGPEDLYRELQRRMKP